MMQFRTLVEALECNRSHQKHVGFIDGQGQEKVVSYEDLYQRALGLLYLLQQKNMGRGDYLVLFLNDNEQMVDVFWACQLGGIIPVPLAVGISDQHRRKVFNVAKKLDRPFLYTNRRNLAKLESSMEDSATSDIYRQLAERVLLSDDVVDLSAAGQIADVAPGDVAFVQFSSGSTGNPKGIVLRHRNLIANIEGIQKGAAFSREDVSLSWMPLTHDMGLIGFHVNPVACDYSHYIMRTDLFIRRPLYWMIAASEKQANVLCSPNFGYKHFLDALERKGLSDVDLSHVRLVFNGAEPISVDLCRQFTSRLARYGLPERSMFPVYGLAEASLAVSFPGIGAGLEVARVQRDSLSIGATVAAASRDKEGVSLVGVGEPVENCEVRISDEYGNALPENTVGHIHIGGTNVTEEIIGGDDSVFFEHGWVDTGDLGFVSGQGLFVTGRHKEILFVNGQNYYPYDIEEVLYAIPNLEFGKVAVTSVPAGEDESDAVLVFVLHKGDLQEFLPLAVQVTAMVSEHFGIALHQVVPVKKIPKTTSGKVQRTLLAENYLTGVYDEVVGRLKALTSEGTESLRHAKHDDEVVDSIMQICQEALPDESFSIHDNLLELGASSLALVEIHAGLDELYPEKIEITDLVERPTIAGLAELIRRNA